MAKTNETGLDKTLDNVVGAAAETNEALAESSNDTGLVANDQPSAQMIFDINTLAPSEKLELMRNVVEAEERIEQIAMPQTKSSDLVGKEFDILNATFQTIPDEKAPNGEKRAVSFVLRLHETGDEITVLKSSNTFNDSYASYFDTIRGIAIKPLLNYTFAVDNRYQKGGNSAIVLKRIPKRVNQVAR